MPEARHRRSGRGSRVAVLGSRSPQAGHPPGMCAMASREGPPLPPAWFLAAPRDPCLGHPDAERGHFPAVRGGLGLDRGC